MIDGHLKLFKYVTHVMCTYILGAAIDLGSFLE
jgi:hypothetical protein